LNLRKNLFVGTTHPATNFLFAKSCLELDKFNEAEGVLLKDLEAREAVSERTVEDDWALANSYYLLGLVRQ